MTSNSQNLTYYQKIEMLCYKYQKIIMQRIKIKEKNIKETDLMRWVLKKEINWMNIIKNGIIN